MGFPTLFYERLRRTKGTKVFFYRDIFALGTIVVTSLIGVGICYSKAAKDLHSAALRGDFNNTPEFEQKKMYLNQLFIPTSSEVLAEHEEREKNWMDGIIRIREFL